MRKSIIVAIDQNNGIGYQNRLPWHLPAELKLFNSFTMGHYLIMGRETYESIGKPLPGRVTIVVTRNLDYQAEGCLIAHSLEAALTLAQAGGENEVFICGGSGIYREALQTSDRLYLTRVHAEFQVDTFFPEFDLSLWTQTSSDFYPADEKNPHAFTITIYERKNEC